MIKRPKLRLLLEPTILTCIRNLKNSTYTIFVLQHVILPTHTELLKNLISRRCGMLLGIRQAN